MRGWHSDSLALSSLCSLGDLEEILPGGCAACSAGTNGTLAASTGRFRATSQWEFMAAGHATCSGFPLNLRQGIILCTAWKNALSHIYSQGCGSLGEPRVGVWRAGMLHDDELCQIAAQLLAPLIQLIPVSSALLSDPGGGRRNPRAATASAGQPTLVCRVGIPSGACDRWDNRARGGRESNLGHLLPMATSYRGQALPSLGRRAVGCCQMS